MTDIVERLRQRSRQYDEYDWHSAIELEAADTIEALRAERDDALDGASTEIRLASEAHEQLRTLTAERDTLREEAVNLRAERDNARADRDALREDAERYLWLRDKATPYECCVVTRRMRPLYGKDLDAAIDAARGKT